MLGGLGHAPVARQEHLDRPLHDIALELAEGTRQGVDHVRQAAGLGPRLALGGEHHDAQRHGQHRTPLAAGRRTAPRRPLAVAN